MGVHVVGLQGQCALEALAGLQGTMPVQQQARQTPMHGGEPRRDSGGTLVTGDGVAELSTPCEHVTEIGMHFVVVGRQREGFPK